MKFEWDENKRQLNIKKHGIDFIDVQNIFYNEPFIITSKQTHLEKRFIALGKIANIPIAVIFIIRNEKIRIISARKARTNERKYIQ